MLCLFFLSWLFCVQKMLLYHNTELGLFLLERLQKLLRLGSFLREITLKTMEWEHEMFGFFRPAVLEIRVPTIHILVYTLPTKKVMSINASIWSMF